MATLHVRDDHLKLAVITIAGPFDPVDLYACVEQHCADGGWTDNLLCDARFMTVGPTPATLREFIGLILAHLEEPPSGRIAILTSDSLMYYEARVYAAMGRDHATIEVFRDEEAATEWLAMGKG
jgi:hypothetical protein